MKKRMQPKNSIFVIIVSALFLVCFLVLMIIGAGTYRSVVFNSKKNNESRAAVSYVSSIIREGDRTDCVYTTEIDGMQVLIIAEEGGKYGRHIYLQDGVLKEIFGRIGVLDPSDAVQIGEAESFSVDISEDGLVTVSTDKSTAYVFLRSAKGGESYDR